MFYTDRRYRFLWAYALRSLAIVLLIGILVRVFLLASFVVDSEGMLPNLLNGDFVIALKKAPLKRGQVVIYDCAGTESCGRRIVGLPGDRVEFTSGKLILNGEPADYDPVGDGITMVEAWRNLRQKVMVGPIEVPAFIVPPNQYFVINDNRTKWESTGSIIDLAAIQGRAWRIWLSLEWRNPDGEIRKWPRVRWSRILQSID